MGSLNVRDNSGGGNEELELELVENDMLFMDGTLLGVEQTRDNPSGRGGDCDMVFSTERTGVNVSQNDLFGLSKRAHTRFFTKR